MNQNTIIIDNVIFKKDIINIFDKQINKIEVNGNYILNLLNCNIIDLNIKVNDNAKIIINYFNICGKLTTNINIEIKEKAHFTLNHSFINYDEYNLNIISMFKSLESNINLNINGINDKGISNINVDGFINYKKNDNNLLENIRLININNGSSKVKPNMIIGTSKVIANHNVTIGNVNKDELIYLMSKGLTKEASIKLICNGHLINIIEDPDLKTKIKEIINGR